MAEPTVDEMVKELRGIGSREEIFHGTLNNISTLQKHQVELFDLETKATNAREAVAAREADIYSKVCAEVDKVTKKPLHTNDGARKAEAARAEAKDAVLVKLKQEERQHARDIFVKKALIQCIDSFVKTARDYLHGS